MSKIHELFNKINDDSILDNELPLSIDEKDRILNMTMNKIPSRKQKKYSKKKLLISILVATMMISTVAMAREYFESNLDNRILNFLGISRDNTSFDKAGTDINKSVTYKGLNLSVVQTLGDNNTLYVLLDVTTPSNIIMPENTSFNNCKVSIDNSKSAGWYMNELKDENPNDNKQSYLLSYSTENLLSGKTITLDLENFGYYDNKNGDFLTLVEGNWNISWKLNYENLTKTFKVNHFVKDSSYKSLITSIDISPISISAKVLGKNYDKFYIKGVVMNDGNTYINNPDSSDSDDYLFISGSTSTSFLKSYTSNDFSKIVDVNEIKSVIIGDEVINLN